MNIDELQSQLAVYNGKLDQSLRLNARLLRTSALQIAGARLRRSSRFLLLDLLGNAAAVALLGLFLADHWAEPRFLVPAIVLDVCAILLVAASAYQLVALSGIDYDAPILVIQKRLGVLKALRIRVAQGILFLSPLLWTPLLIVSLRGFLGIDAYAFGNAWLFGNLLFGLAFLVLMVWGSRRYADRMQKSPAIQRLMNSLAGRDLTAAMAFLESLSQVEAEDQRA
jgi:hypothetical protein